MNTSTLIAAVVGFAAGALVTWLNNRGKDSAPGANAPAAPSADIGSRQAEIVRQTELYQELSRQFEEYRQQVNRHFADAAGAIDELSRCYQNVINRLDSGAQALMDAQALQQQLEQRGGTAVAIAYLTNDATALKQDEPENQPDAPSDEDTENQAVSELVEAEEQANQTPEKPAEDTVDKTAENQDEQAEDAENARQTETHDDAQPAPAEEEVKEVAAQEGGKTEEVQEESSKEEAGESANGQNTEQNKTRVYY